MLKQLSVTLLLLVLASPLFCQDKPFVQFDFNESGSRYLRFRGLAQVWLRHTDMNPGTTIFGYDSDSYSDASIRRLRFEVFGKLTDRVFFYSQFGMNNFNYHSEKFEGAFFHDAVVEFEAVENKLSVGGGLTAWGGPTRYSSPSTGTLMSVDAPLYQQSTNGVNDQFIRKLSLYVKGQLGRLDYRLALSQPFNVNGAPFVTTEPTGTHFTFSNEIPEKQIQGYVKYMFGDKESNLTPYQTGTYLGTKSVFNVGAGISHQGNATWALDESGETIREAMTLIGVDVYLDRPVSEQSAITVYAALTHTSYGDGFLRYVGVNNAATGGSSSIQGNYGNGFPMHGNGTVTYAQAGYLFGQGILTENGKLLPFVAMQYGDYDRLEKPLAVYEAGASFLLNGNHNTKIGIMYQSRPTYTESGDMLDFDARKGMTVLQLQAAF